MDAKVYELINDQINKELYSAYLYLSFADYYEEEGLSGYANYFEIQAQEERDHAMIFRNYCLLYTSLLGEPQDRIPRKPLIFVANLCK